MRLPIIPLPRTATELIILFIPIYLFDKAFILICNNFSFQFQCWSKITCVRSPFLTEQLKLFNLLSLPEAFIQFIHFLFNSANELRIFDNLFIGRIRNLFLFTPFLYI